MDISGELVDVSGGVVDVSGTDVSGGVVDVSGTDVSGTDVSGTDVSGGGIVDITSGQIAVIPTPPPPIRLEDILGSQQLLVAQEANDRISLESIGTIPYDTLKPRLIQWAASGFRNATTIYEIPMVAPPLCSDGQARGLQDYIEFVSGRTISDHVAALQARVPDFVVSFAYSGVSIMIVVSRSG